MEEKKVITLPSSSTTKRRRRRRHLTGEDIDMFHEREQENRSKKRNNICDTHIDGA